MRETYIWGAGHYGVLTALDCEQNGVKINCFIDKNANQIKNRLGLPVLILEQILSKTEKDKPYIIIAVQNEEAIKEIIETLSLAGFKKDIDFEFSHLIQIPVKHFKVHKRGMAKNFVLKYLEVHLAEHCNLNCAYCTHNCPVADPEFPSIEQFELDFIKLSKLTNGTIEELKLMGGEPLLNPDITRIVKIARKNIPNSEIVITTNGILLPNMNSDFWETCKNNNISIVISQYPIKLNIGKIYQLAKKYAVNVLWATLLWRKNRNNLFWSRQYDMDGTNNVHKVYEKCPTKTCTFLKDGKIYLCAQIPCSKYLQKAFNVNFSISDNDFLILDKINNLQEILDFISKPSPFCKYCTIDTQFVQWKISEKKKEEWIL